MKKELIKKVIGTAIPDMEKCREFSAELPIAEQMKQKRLSWSEKVVALSGDDVLWDTAYDRKMHSVDTEQGYEALEQHAKYLEKMGLSFELIHLSAEFPFAEGKHTVAAIIRSGNDMFLLPKDCLASVNLFKDLDDIPLSELRLGISGSKDTALIPENDITRTTMNDRIRNKMDEIREAEEQIKAVEREKKAELERLKAELDLKFKDRLSLLDQKKEELAEQQRRMEQELFLLDTEIYGIRCLMGETVKFSTLRKGKHAHRETPVVLYQKLRFLDEEMSAYFSMYGFDGNDIGIFEDVLKARDDIVDLFAPTEKCISLIRISRNGVFYKMNDSVANLLDAYKTYHGGRIGILIKDGENLWIGWTDEDRVDIKEDAFLKPRSEYEDEYSGSSSKEEVASRYFLFSILQGVLNGGHMLSLPDDANIFRSNPYVIFSMAEGWLDDNRFGDFADIIKEPQAQVMSKGDMILTTIKVTRDDYYSSQKYHAWWNQRGRGDANRTHDAVVNGMEVYPINKVDVIKRYGLKCKRYLCVEEKVQNTGTKTVHGKQEEFTYETTRMVKTDICADDKGIIEFLVTNDDYYGSTKGMTPERLLDHYKKVNGTERSLRHDKSIKETEAYKANAKTCSGEYAWYEPYGVELVKTERKYFVSAEKTGYYASDDRHRPRANMQVYEDEYLNLTYLNSVWIAYAIRTHKIGKWYVGHTNPDYAGCLPYLNAALEYLKKREREEAALLEKYMELYPDWQVDLSKWRMERQYHSLTDTRAKKFAKEFGNRR